ncbi:hypothetical protein [Streptomyces stelliscabiei]|uniref:hypothetical protein n=1 Tax=Streptomyces stelliscabiei TaxID=146820 RepID=UPI003EBFABAD
MAPTAPGRPQHAPLTTAEEHAFAALSAAFHRPGGPGMTAHPIDENAGHWVADSGQVAAPPRHRRTSAPEQLRITSTRASWFPRARRSQTPPRLELPGLFSRPAAAAAPLPPGPSIPTGYGTPVNEASLKEDQAA